MIPLQRPSTSPTSSFLIPLSVSPLFNSPSSSTSTTTSHPFSYNPSLHSFRSLIRSLPSHSVSVSPLFISPSSSAKPTPKITSLFPSSYSFTRPFSFTSPAHPCFNQLPLSSHDHLPSFDHLPISNHLHTTDHSSTPDHLPTTKHLFTNNHLSTDTLSSTNPINFVVILSGLAWSKKRSHLCRILLPTYLVRALLRIPLVSLVLPLVREWYAEMKVATVSAVALGVALAIIQLMMSWNWSTPFSTCIKMTVT